MNVVPLPKAPNPKAFIWMWDEIFGGERDGLLELAWTPTGSKPNTARLFSYDEKKEFIAVATETNINGGNNYVAPALRKPGTPKNEAMVIGEGRTQKPDFYATNCVWADLDTDEAVKAAKERYRGCPPNFWVVTARHPHVRVQLWWRLKEPLYDPVLLESILGGLQRNFDSDKAVVNCVNLMRLGGSINRSPKKGRIPELTEFGRP